VQAVDRFPEMTDASLRVLAKIDALLDQVGEQKLPQRSAGALTEAEATLAGIKKTFADINAAEVSQRAQQTLAQLDGTISHMNAILARVEGDKGVIGSAERASAAVGDVATNARDFTDELGTTLHEVQLAAESLHKLTDALERDPDMLLKGRARR